MIKSTNYGHETYSVDGENWFYSDDDSPISDIRPCPKCRELPTAEGYDACIGYIPGASSVCCGHGVTEPILVMKHELENIKDGGYIIHDDGSRVDIRPHSEREHLAVLGKTVYEFLFYNSPLDGEDESDRIHILITHHDGEKSGLLLNFEDVIIFMRGLSVCMQKALENNVPFTPSNNACSG